MTFFVTLEAGHLLFGWAVPRNMALLLAVETSVGTTLGTLTREVAVFAALEAFRRCAATSTATTLWKQGFVNSAN